MTAQASLFDAPAEDLPTPTRPRAGLHHRRASKSEVAGAIAAAPKAGTHRARILQAIVEAGSVGMTRHEVVHHTGLPINVVTGRVAELIGQHEGHVKPTGQGDWVRETQRTRPGPTGSPNAVLYATTRGEDWAKQERRRG